MVHEPVWQQPAAAQQRETDETMQLGHFLSVQQAFNPGPEIALLEEQLSTADIPDEIFESIHRRLFFGIASSISDAGNHHMTSQQLAGMIRFTDGPAALMDIFDTITEFRRYHPAAETVVLYAKAALDGAPDHPDVKSALAFLYLRRGQYSDAIMTVAGMDDPRASLCRGIAFHYLDAEGTAEKHLRAAIKGAEAAVESNSYLCTAVAMTALVYLCREHSSEPQATDAIMNLLPPDIRMMIPIPKPEASTGQDLYALSETWKPRALSFFSQMRTPDGPAAISRALGSLDLVVSPSCLLRHVCPICCQGKDALFVQTIHRLGIQSCPNLQQLLQIIERGPNCAIQTVLESLSRMATHLCWHVLEAAHSPEGDTLVTTYPQMAGAEVYDLDWSMWRTEPVALANDDTASSAINECIAHLTAASVYTPGSLPVQYVLAQLILAKNMSMTAFEHLLPLLKHSQTYHKFLLLGRLFASRGQTDEAVMCYSHCIQQRYADPFVWVITGQLFHQMALPNEARYCFRIAKKLASEGVLSTLADRYLAAIPEAMGEQRLDGRLPLPAKLMTLKFEPVV
ncbi:hypothetical protein J8273_7416 [Carpediemonas membranifera]|uniref:Uncharacterized protein n=1 Tax=Carpediemonas membranifera TaxID=201153 RepID=A0A8J6B1Q6_9EUKA|nr:hypothetical protein J8273_7416 [Carpediemonas membranifera]|eukprot:KAG9391142.1 hypothetical protein J8273_7416 [Carpediemonas membranifera]